MEKRIWESKSSVSQNYQKRINLSGFLKIFKIKRTSNPIANAGFKSYQTKKVYSYKKLSAFLALLLIAIVAYYFIYPSDYFNVKTINIDGAPDEDKGRISSLYVYEFDNEKIFSISDESVREVSVKLVPAYRFLKFEKYWPDRILVSLEKRVPVRVIQASNGVFFIDKDYFVMDSANAFIGYEIEVKYDKDLNLGQTIIDPALLAAFSYVSEETLVTVQNSEISIQLDEGGKVLLPKDNSIANYDELSRILQKIIQKYTIENKYIETIDLRFSKPLIKSAPKN